jgi:hypothetical protein
MNVHPAPKTFFRRNTMRRFVCSYCLLFLSLLVLCANQSRAQRLLDTQHISAAEKVGKNTEIPMKLGTLVQAKAGGGFQAFVTTPSQRIAYAVSDKSSRNHGSGAPDPLVNELHLNRLRVTGLPFPTGAGQHNSRKVVICDATLHTCLNPAHQVLDVNQVVAEFEMPDVTALVKTSRTIIIRIQTDAGSWEPDIPIVLSALNKLGK